MERAKKQSMMLAWATAVFATALVAWACLAGTPPAQAAEGVAYEGQQAQFTITGSGSASVANASDSSTTTRRVQNSSSAPAEVTVTLTPTGGGTIRNVSINNGVYSDTSSTISYGPTALQPNAGFTVSATGAYTLTVQATVPSVWYADDAFNIADAGSATQGGITLSAGQSKTIAVKNKTGLDVDATVRVTTTAGALGNCKIGNLQADDAMVFLEAGADSSIALVASGSSGATVSIEVIAEIAQDVSYTVEYRDADTAAVLAPAKTMTAKVGSTVYGKPADIEGYAVSSISPEHALLQIGKNAGQNLIVFKYRKCATYTVNYYLDGTTTKLAKSSSGYMPGGSAYRLEPIAIEGYTPVESVLRGTFEWGEEVSIDFHYTKAAAPAASTASAPATASAKVAAPAKVKGLKAKAGKKKLTVTWKKASGATKYQVAYKLKGAKKFKQASAKKAKKVLKKLKSKKRYTVKVRALKTVGGTTYAGSWSKAKTVKVK